MIIFLSPAVMDAIVFLVLFAVSYGAGARGMDTRQCAWLGGIFQLVYMACSLGIGFVLTRRNSRLLVLASIVVAGLGAGLALALQAYRPLLAALALFGLGTAMFFNAFQTFMRGEAPPGGLARATALYTAAWSGGASIGFLVSGSLYKLGAWPLLVLVTVVSAVIFIQLALHRSKPGHEQSADDHVEAAPDGNAGLHEAFVGVAWVMIFTAMFVQRPLQTFFPAQNGREGVAAALVGIPLFLHMFLQAVSGGLMLKMRRWLYRRDILAAIQLSVAAILAWLWRFPFFAVTATGIAVLGLWAGFMYFCAVFYASNAGNRSRNIGVNECLVGLGSFAGLFVSEWFMTRFNQDSAMYAVCAATVILSVGVQMILAGRRRRR
ncbi:MAG: MFS transporter [Kiritimatiellia bacterium]